jgi:acetyl esterase/lipase
MNMKKHLSLIVFITISFFSFSQTPVYLWSGQVPGETDSKHDPVQTPNKDGNVIRLTDVTNPAFFVFKPEANINNGAGVIICPGGAYNILSFDKEGTEIATWLTNQGFTAFVLEYRVPKKQEGALMDIQRAIRIIRNDATNYGLQPNKLGVMGFSAGGSLSARAATLSAKKTYTPVDKTDSVSCRPDFALLIYPAYLDLGTNRALTPELTINHSTPPIFIFATADDNYSNSALVMTTALRDAKLPVELHFLAKGGHGYGLRTGNIAGETWPKLAEIWLKNIVAGK